ncbi:Mitochodrial transcription termination factor [Phytophthora cactorum]|nr:Mitochodrial transcription termination factor [Phytophthora cactorum]
MPIVGFSTENPLCPCALQCSGCSVPSAVADAREELCSSSPAKPVDDAVAARRQQSIYYARFTRKYPTQLGPLPMEAVDRTARYLTSRGLNQTQALRAISRHIMITCYSQKMMESKIEWLSNLGLSHDKINDILARHPIILGCSFEKLESLVQWYISHGVPEKKMPYLFNVFPEVAAFSMAKLDKKVDFFKELGCDDGQIARILTMAPRVLGYSVEKLQVNVDYLEEMGVPSEHIPAITARVPQFLGLTTDRIKETVDAMDEMFGAGAGGHALIRNSRIVMHNVSGIRRAYSYLLSVGFTKERLKQCTRFVMRSESRILRPRVKFLKAKGVDVVSAASWILMPEGRFIEKYSDYAAYLTQYMARLKKKQL